MKKSRLAALVLVPALLLGAACESSPNQRQSGKNSADEQKRVGDSFQRLSDSQQIPTFDYSQERQTLIDVESARATGAVTTTAFYLEGVGLVEWCPSIGAPVASTSQLSASKQWVDLPGDNTRDRLEVDQGEPVGVYVGQSSGTWTLCLDDGGKKFAVYWEGYVHSTVGVVSSYPADKRLVITSSTYNFTDKKK